MGDRANVRIKESEDASVFLYTHWGGHELADDVQVALKRKQRWDDSSYLARIIFDQMVGDQQGDETGFGISTYMPDNEHPIITLDCDTQQIWLSNEDGSEIADTRLTFQLFIELASADVLKKWYDRDYKRKK